MEEYRKISDEDRQRRKRLEEVRKEQKRRKIISVTLSSLIIAAVCIVGVWLCYTRFFKVSKCVVKGDVPYTADEMLAGSGYEKGMLLYALDEKTVEQNVMYNLPFVDSFKMKRFWPGTVVFEVQKAEPSMYVTLSGENFVLSQSMRVLSQTKDFSYIESEKLLHVKFSSVERCVAGEFLVTKDKSADTAKEIFALLEQNSLVSDVGEIDLTDKFEISFSYKNNYVVELGDNRSLDKKIKFMIGIVNRLHEGTSGIIDVSDENVKEGILKSF